jgi:hypothetical protein
VIFDFLAEVAEITGDCSRESASRQTPMKFDSALLEVLLEVRQATYRSAT